jgi:hypothetical protein
MSTGKRRVRRLQPQTRRRAPGELRVAVLAALAVVGGTVLGVWLLRPGGLASRQPRAAWLATAVVGGLVAVVVWARRARRPEQRRARGLAGTASVLAAAAVAAVLWPGGIVKDDGPPPADFDLSELLGEPTISVPEDAAPVTTGPGSTEPAPSPTTAPAPITTVPASTPEETAP